MEKIPTAEEFNNDIRYVTYSLDEKLITFAKLHVEAALKAASENVKYREQITMQGVQRTFSVNSILNAYPLENIK